MSSAITIRDKSDFIRQLSALRAQSLATAAAAEGLMGHLTGGVSTPASIKSPAQSAVSKRNRKLSPK